MRVQVVEIEGLGKPPLTFNHVVRAGEFLFVTSQLSADLQTGELLSGDVRSQTRRAISNLEFLLEHAGSAIEHVAQVRIYLRNAGDLEAVDEVYRDYFPPNRAPARVAVQAPSLLHGIDVEIEATAVLP